MPQLVISAQRRGRHYLKILLPKFFTHLDDSLFKLAQNSDHNDEQTLYFDAMREVRLRQEEILQACLKAFDQGFRLSLGTPKNSFSLSPLENTFTLMGDDQLEITLAISNMVSHAETLFRGELFGIISRFDFLIEEMEITKNNNPLRPEIICQAFVEATECLQLELKVKLIIYKLFDQFVVQKLGVMYQSINDDLIAAGVLPRLKTSIVKSDSESPAPERREPAAAKAAAGHDHTAEEFGADVFNVLQNLLQHQRGIAPGSGTAGGGHSGAAGATFNAIPPQDVLTALSSLQIGNELPLLDNKEQPSATLIKEALIQVIAQAQGAAHTGQINQAETDTIDIVSMLFDFILDDPGLSVHFKAQIARLQIPMLKVAILDKGFFSHKTHPARQLLNELAYAGGGLDAADIENDITFQMVCHTVEQILTRFEQNFDIFSELLQEFTHFMEAQRQVNQQEEETLVQAHDAVAAAIQQRVAGASLPPFVKQILVQPWKDVLTHLILRDGKDSSAWNTALQVADDLIWSVKPMLKSEDRQRLTRVIPRILNGLRDGLTLIRYDHAACDQLFAGLEELHLTSLRGGIAPKPAATSRAPSADAGVEAYDEDFRLGGAAAPAGSAAAPNDELMEEIILASSQPWLEADAGEADLHPEIRDMALGTWVEFIDADSGQRKRGKLSWKCDFTGDYTFVDRRFKVVADVNFRALVQDFAAGRAQWVEDVPLFDRALNAVIGSIKQTMSRQQDETAQPA